MVNNTYTLNTNFSVFNNLSQVNPKNYNINLNTSYSSNYRPKGEMHSRRTYNRTPKNPGKFVKRKLLQIEQERVPQQFQSSQRKIQIVNINDIDADLNGCASINLNAGYESTIFSNKGVFKSSEDLQKCAPKDSVQKIDCEWYRSCNEKQTAPKVLNKCDAINLNAGNNDKKFEDITELVQCMPKDGDTYFTNSRPKVGCLFAGELNDRDGSKLGSGIFCEVSSSAQIPFRVGGALIKGRGEWFVPFVKGT